MVSLELDTWEVRKVAVVAGKLVVDVAHGTMLGRLTIESLVNGHEPGDFGSTAEGLVGARILHADADDFGSLNVEFEHGLTVQVDALRDREAWNFFSSTAFGVVCAPGGSVAVFRSEQEWEKLRAEPSDSDA